MDNSISKFALVGYTGFVGSNILHGYNSWVEKQSTQENFSIDLYNSKNASELAGKEYDVLILACLPGHVDVANRYPEKDRATMESILDNISKIKSARYVFLMSTIFVTNQDTYGSHRLEFEQRVQKIFTNENKDIIKFVVFRLPGIYGTNLKKNIIYDFMHPAPSFIRIPKMTELLSIMSDEDASIMQRAYKKNEVLNQYDLCISSPELIEVLFRAGFTSLNFWHPEDEFYWYDIRNLFNDILFYAYPENSRNIFSKLCLFENSKPITAKAITEALEVDINLLKAKSQTRKISKTSKDNIDLSKESYDNCETKVVSTVDTIKSIVKFINAHK